MSGVTDKGAPPLMSGSNPNAKQGVECINEMFDFFRFSRLSLDSSGTCVFRIQKGDTEHVRAIRLNPGHAAEVFHGYPHDGNVTVECTTSFEVFEGVYLNTVDVTSAVLTGKIRVKYFKYNSLRTFFNNFDLSTEKWDAYYSWKAQESKLKREMEQTVIDRGIKAIPESLDNALDRLVSTSLLLGVEDVHIAKHGHEHMGDASLQDLFVLEPLVDRSPLDAVANKLMDVLGVSVIKQVPSLFREEEQQERYGGIADAKLYLTEAVPHLSSAQLSDFEQNLISLLAATSDVRKQYHDQLYAREQHAAEQVKPRGMNRTMTSLDSFNSLDSSNLDEFDSIDAVESTREVPLTLRVFESLPYKKNLECTLNNVVNIEYMSSHMSNIPTAVDHVTRALYGSTVRTYTPNIDNFHLFEGIVPPAISDVRIEPQRFLDVACELSPERILHDVDERMVIPSIRQQHHAQFASTSSSSQPSLDGGDASPVLRFQPDAQLTRALKNTLTRVVSTVTASIQDNCCHEDFDGVRRGMFSQVNAYFGADRDRSTVKYQAFGRDEWAVPDPSRVSRTCNLALTLYKNHHLREMDLSQLVIKAALDATLEGQYLEYVPLEALRVIPEKPEGFLEQMVNGVGYAASSSYSMLMSFFPSDAPSTVSSLPPVVVEPTVVVAPEVVQVPIPVLATTAKTTTTDQTTVKPKKRPFKFDLHAISSSFQKHILAEMNSLL